MSGRLSEVSHGELCPTHDLSFTGFRWNREVRRGALLIGTIAIDAYQNFGATIYNESQQWSISRQNVSVQLGRGDDVRQFR